MKGPGNKAKQIKSLKKKLGEVDIERAEYVANNYNADIIALAFKLTRNQSRLPKSVEKLLAKLPEHEADIISDKLLGINSD